MLTPTRTSHGPPRHTSPRQSRAGGNEPGRKLGQFRLGNASCSTLSGMKCRPYSPEFFSCLLRLRREIASFRNRRRLRRCADSIPGARLARRPWGQLVILNSPVPCGPSSIGIRIPESLVVVAILRDDSRLPDSKSCQKKTRNVARNRFNIGFKPWCAARMKPRISSCLQGAQCSR